MKDDNSIENMRKQSFKEKQLAQMQKALPIITKCLTFAPIFYVVIASILLSQGKLIEVNVTDGMLYLFAAIVIFMSFAAKSIIASYFNKIEEQEETSVTTTELVELQLTTLSAFGIPSFVGLLLSFLSGEMKWVIIMSAISIAASLLLKPDLTKFEAYKEIKEANEQKQS
ncbi:MAG: hypothetical protein GY804_10235 [Alphaproteobacteria bacterium]|nr:hypothetical protein [Alphaproteobacteria bacterium]